MTILQSDWTGDQEVSIGGWQRHISGDSLADDIRRQWSLRRSLGYETHSHQGPFPQSAAYKSAWRKSQSGETQSAPHQPVYVTPFVRTNECISRAEDAGTGARKNQVLRRVAAGLSDDGSQLSPISWSDLPGDVVRPKFSNI